MRKLGWFLPVLLLVTGCASPTDEAGSPGAASAMTTLAETSSTMPTIAATASASTTAAPTMTTAPTTSPSATAVPAPALTAAWSYPIGMSERALGDGFFIRHGYTAENTWYNPGYWHTGEDWYALEGDTAGANVYAVADGEVVYAGSNYPGRVVIMRHADDLFSMYGHLDPALAVAPAQQVTQGQQLGTVLRRSDNVPSHLHFEIRTFLTTRAVNGEAPRYDFRCGTNCPPGPGYWPIAAPDLPTALGWRNPTHVIARRAFPAEPSGELGEVVVAAEPISSSVTLWAAVTEDGAAQQALGEVSLRPGARMTLLAIRAGVEDSQTASAQAYGLWYRVRLPDRREGWIVAAVPSTFETGSDGRPSTTRFNLYPASEAQPPPE